VTLVTTVSCGNENLPKYRDLKNLRLLGLIADAPEVAPGSTVTITPVISDTEGNGRGLLYTAESCLDLGLSYGGSPNCENNPTRTIVANSQPVTGLSGPAFTAAVSSTFSVTVPSSAVIFAGRSSIEQHNGVPYLINYRVLASDGSVSVSAFKRVLVSTRTTKNQNPVLSDIFSEGLPMSSYPVGPVRLKPNYPEAAMETYAVMDSQSNISTKTEEIRMLWFTNYGKVVETPTEAKGETSYEPITKPDDKTVVLVGLLKDDRGGAAVKILTF